MSNETDLQELRGEAVMRQRHQPQPFSFADLRLMAETGFGVDSQRLAATLLALEGRAAEIAAKIERILHAVPKAGERVARLTVTLNGQPAPGGPIDVPILWTEAPEPTDEPQRSYWQATHLSKQQRPGLVIADDSDVTHGSRLDLHAAAHEPERPHFKPYPGPECWDCGELHDPTTHPTTCSRCDHVIGESCRGPHIKACWPPLPAEYDASGRRLP